MPRKRKDDWNETLAAGSPKYLTDEQLSAVLRAADEDRDTRFGLLVWTLALTGCRLSEALKLGWNDAMINGKGPVIRLRTLKRRRPEYRFIPVPDDLMNRWNRVRLQSDDPRPFPFPRQWAYERVREIMKRAGVSRDRCHPHVLRHTYAVRAVQRGVPMLALQRLLGHASPQTTAIYYRIIPDDLREWTDRLWNGDHG